MRLKLHYSRIKDRGVLCVISQGDNLYKSSSQTRDRKACDCGDESAILERDQTSSRVAPGASSLSGTPVMNGAGVEQCTRAGKYLQG